LHYVERIGVEVKLVVTTRIDRWRSAIGFRDLLDPAVLAVHRRGDFIVVAAGIPLAARLRGQVDDLELARMITKPNFGMVATAR
jgi:hypothetical protein